MRLLFKGGTVVTGKGPRRADILVEGEKILDVCRDIPAIGAQVVDVTGMLLFPGFIDAHTHFDLDVCNTTTADDFASGSRAALHGGTVMVASREGDGLRVVVSLPIRDTAGMFLRAPAASYDPYGGFSPLLLELSDVLPAELYRPEDVE